MKRELIFVYNANSDPLSAMVDYAHKLFRPSTYACDLCALTHHNLGERAAWKKFKERSNVDMDFMYIRGFEATFNLRYDYPVIIERCDEQFKEILTKTELKQMITVEELIDFLEDYLIL